MRPIALIVLMLTAILCPFYTSAVQEQRELREKLEKFIEQQPTLDCLGQLYRLSDETTNSSVRILIIKASGAGLLHLNDFTRYANAIRSKIPNPEDFEDSLMQLCPACHGTLQVEISCELCKGDSKCTNKRCNDGRVKVKGFDGQSSQQECFLCKGTGTCAACNGDGTSKVKCTTCNERGRTFSAADTLKAYESFVIDALQTLTTPRADAQKVLIEEDAAHEIEKSEPQQVQPQPKVTRTELMPSSELDALKKKQNELMGQIRSLSLNSRFKILQTFDESHLCYNSRLDKTFIAIGLGSKYVDDDWVSAVLYPIGTESFTTVLGAKKTVRVYTTTPPEEVIKLSIELQKTERKLKQVQDLWDSL